MKNSLVRNRSMWRCDVLGSRLQSAEEERGKLVKSVLARVGVAAISLIGKDGVTP